MEPFRTKLESSYSLQFGPIEICCMSVNRKFLALTTKENNIRILKSKKSQILHL